MFHSRMARIRPALVAALVAAMAAAAYALAPAPSCLGDCDDDGRVVVGEIVTCVTVVLGIQPPTACAACPATIAEIIAAVNNALDGCRNTPPGRCRQASDCNPSSHLCLEPGGVAGCGACYPDHLIDQMYRRCSTDTECESQPPRPAQGGICERLGIESRTCSPCSGSVSVCVLGCTADADCDAAQACVLGRCIGRPCSTEQACPGQSACPGDGEGERRCVRRACGSDAECPDGMCVNGTCHSELGRCTLYPS